LTLDAVVDFSIPKAFGVQLKNCTCRPAGRLEPATKLSYDALHPPLRQTAIISCLYFRLNLFVFNLINIQSTNRLTKGPVIRTKGKTARYALGTRPSQLSIKFSVPNPCRAIVARNET